MPIHIRTKRQIETLITQAVEKSHHHGQPVVNTILAVSAAMREHFNRGNDIKVRPGTTNAMGNVLTVTTERGKSVIAYNHHTKEIEVRRDNVRGAIRHSFDDATPVPVVYGIIAAL